MNAKHLLHITEDFSSFLVVVVKRRHREMNYQRCRILKGSFRDKTESSMTSLRLAVSCGC